MQGTPEGQKDLVEVEGLGQVVDRPASHRLDRRVDRRVGGEDNDVELRFRRQHFRQQFQAALVAQPQVEEGGVETAPAQFPHHLVAGGHLDAFMAQGVQRDAGRFADVSFVVNNQNVHNQEGKMAP